MSSRISVVKCSSYAPNELERSLEKALGLLGGITAFIKPGSRVLIKPNLLMSKPPECAITTHPQFIRAVIGVLRQIDCRISLGDSPSVWGKYINNLEEVYRVTGIQEVCRQENIELINFNSRRMRDKFPLAAALDECDYLVNLPKFKTHEFTLISGSIKNLFGLVSGTYKTELHKSYFHPGEFAGILAEIYRETRPCLTIVDGILALEGDGPATSGKPRELGLLMAGQDCVALDAVMSRIMGMDSLAALSTRKAYDMGLGEARLENIKIEGEAVEELKIKPFILPKSSLKLKLTKAPELLQGLVKALIKYYPESASQKCSGCGHCAGICPMQCISFFKKGDKRLPNFNYRKCIACFCCQEACPEAAIGVKRSFLARMIGL